MAPFVAAVFIVLLAAVLRFEGVGRDSLWYDESASLQYAQWPLSHPRHWNNGMALFHTILHGWIRLAGESPTALRLPSAVFGTAAVALLIVLVRRLNGWPTALTAGLLLAIAWRHIYYSQEARSYSLFIMLALLATLLFLRLLDKPSSARLFIYGIVLVALSYTHYQWVFVLAFHNLTLLLSRRRVGWGWLILHAVVFLLYIPQVVLGLLPQMHASLEHMPRNPAIPEALWALQDFFSLAPHEVPAGATLSARNLNVLALYLLPLLAFAGLVACAWPIALRLLPSSRRYLPTLSRYTVPRTAGKTVFRPTWLPLVWFAVAFVLPYLAAQTGKPFFRWRYMAGNLPVYCWLIAIAITAVPYATIRIPVLAVCVLLAAPAIETMKQRPMREDWRALADEIMQVEQPGGQIIFFPGRLQRPFNQAYPGLLPKIGLDGPLATDTAIAHALAWETPPERVWLIVAHPAVLPEPLLAYFEHAGGYRLARFYDVEFRGILLFRFERLPQKETPGAHTPGVETPPEPTASSSSPSAD